MRVEIVEAPDFAPCAALRRRVFMDEQGFTEAEEFDALDADAIHLLGLVDGVPMGTARLLRAGDVGKIGRVCVLPEARGTGLGARLIEASLARLAKDPALSRAYLSAQTQAIGFYERAGFAAEGPEYLDGTVPHRDMWRALRPGKG
ncbi:GNAT family N-acetyltransferase [Frigidibacter sp. MR17.14]|uniref:GNAT family N-acetyltransferase n=1 Tax=Frigidibacter sp. MR17.14 TaxID=3126509 RepID=UPI003012ABFA